MKQFDKRILEGVELSARYDQGRIFGDIGISYNIKINSAIKVQQFEMLVVRVIYVHLKAYPECVNGGNENGYLKKCHFTEIQH